MSSIHGHEVLAMMAENSYHSDAELLAAIEQKFGQTARFHTCSQDDMSAEQLIEFLKAKGKFMPTNDAGFTVDTSRICNH